MADLILTKEEEKTFNEWLKDHHDRYHGGRYPYSGAAGGAISFHWTQTGLGDETTVHCAHCKNKPEHIGHLTDISLW